MDGLLESLCGVDGYVPDHRIVHLILGESLFSPEFPSTELREMLFPLMLLVVGEPASSRTLYIEYSAGALYGGYLAWGQGISPCVSISLKLEESTRLYL